MIERYTRPEMGALWSTEARFQCLLEVEMAAAGAQAELGLIPKKAAKDINEKGAFQLERILEIEKETKHDIIAFVSNVAENVGENGRYVHYGLTSSDALDTALSVQVSKAEPILTKVIDELLASFRTIIENNRHTICSGRTHGMHAEPTTFGLKMAGYYAEFIRGKKRMVSAFEQMKIGKLGGAVGTFSFLSPEVEQKVCDKLGLKPESVATQVIPRDRHAELLNSLAMLGGAIERISIELRHLQRTEVGEVVEGFTPGQKGSSAMPHKKNPISGENLTGCARLLRSYAGAAMENIALWHERDISHSSVERVAFPDAFILTDYALARLTKLISGLYVDEARMKKNMDLSAGQLFSSHLLLHLVDQGLSREEAYEKVQSASHGLKPGEHLKNTLLVNTDTKEFFTTDVVDEIFSGKRHLRRVDQVIDKVLNEGKNV